MLPRSRAVKIRRQKHWGWGFEDQQPAPADVRATASALAAHLGLPLGEIEDRQLRFALVVRLPEKQRSTPEAIRAIEISTPSGARVPLSEWATIEIVKGPAKISREQGQRLITLQCNVRDRDIGG